MAYRSWLLVFALMLFAWDCAAAAFAQTSTHAAPPAMAPVGSLYSRLGGTPRVTDFVNDTVDAVAASPRTNRSFDKLNLQQVKDMLVEQICSLTGGGCTYSGNTMRDIYAGHRISNAEFFSLVEVLRESMRAHDVPQAARNELLEILVPVKRDLVEL